MYPRILDPQPSITELIVNRKYWNSRVLHYRRVKIAYDQPIRIGECYCCKKLGKAQWKPKTYLHHLFYDDSDPLAYTLEVCGKCHYKIDQKNRIQLNRNYGRYDTNRDTMSNVSRRYY